MNAPSSFEPQLATLGQISIVRKPSEIKTISFSLAFVTKQAELDALSKVIANKAKGDAIIWFAYPKKSSRKYTCEFNRDSGWTVLGEAGFEGVRQVAIDEDWSALRFRRVEFIKSMNRDPKRALSKEGKKRAASKRQ